MGVKGATHWPEAHNDRLRQLWADGLSAAQIAEALNREFRTTYSRNAAIGRVHRMGLSGRGKASKPRHITHPPAAPRLVQTRIAMSSPVAPAMPAHLQCGPKPYVPIPDGAPGTRTVMTIRPFGECRWPMGDPQDADFTLCGAAHQEAGPYCQTHRARAYAPPTARQSAKELARSLRRYA